MFALVVVSNCQLLPLPLARAVGQDPLAQPTPYSYGYQASDEFGTTWTREESGDGSGAVKGSYSYREANGIGRTVEYFADETGFHANVITNEPGTVDSAPADALYRTAHN